MVLMYSMMRHLIWMRQLAQIAAVLPAKRQKIKLHAADSGELQKTALTSGEVTFNSSEDAEKKVSLQDIALKSTFFNNMELQSVKQHSSPLSPPPFMVGMAEVEVDMETGNDRCAWIMWQRD